MSSSTTEIDNATDFTLLYGSMHDNTSSTSMENNNTAEEDAYLFNENITSTIISTVQSLIERDPITTMMSTVTTILNNSSILPEESTTTFSGIVRNVVSNDTSMDSLTPFPKAMLGFTATCAFIIAILGASGNLLTIFALPMCKKLRTTATAFVINLALVEFLFCIVILPMSGAQYAYLQYTDESLLSKEDCKIFALARYTFTQVQLQTIIGIALMRAIAVGLPSLYMKINSFRVVITYIVIIWLYSFFLKLPTAFGVYGSYTFNVNTMECDMAMDEASANARRIQMFTEAFIPVLTVIGLYIFIFVMVKRSSMRVRRSSIKTMKSTTASTVVEEPSGTAEEPPITEIGRKASTTSFKSLKRMVSQSSFTHRITRRSSSITQCMNNSRRDMRVARTIFIIFLMVLVCTVPVGIVHTIETKRKRSNPKRLLAVHILYWIQYSLNVVVYVLMNQQYRDAYVDFLAKLLPYWERHRGFTFPWENASTVSAMPRGGLNSSFRSKKDSCTDPSPNGKDMQYPKVPTGSSSPRQHGRLSAIAEVNSSSCISSDDVFADDKKLPVNNDLNDNQLQESKEDSSSVKDHSEEGSTEEKETWLSSNGTSSVKEHSEEKTTEEKQTRLSNNGTSSVKDHSEEGTTEEKQTWLSSNGTTSTDPPDDSAVQV